MSSTASPLPRGGPATPSAGAEGFVLLAIDHAVVKQYFEEEEIILAKGQLQIQCVSLPIPPEIGRQTANPFAPSPSDPPVPTHDFWLVFHVGATFEIVATPGQMLVPHVDANGVTYAMPSGEVPGASVLFTVPKPRSGPELEQLEGLETLLGQYGCLVAGTSALTDLKTSGNPSIAAAPEEYRGKLVLVNEDNGEIIGEMHQDLELEEDVRISLERKNKPVVLNFDQLRAGQEALKVKVQTVPEDELNDWMLKGANSISQAILSFGAWSSRQLVSGADRYVKTTTPRAEPVQISPQTKENFMKVHNASLKTATVTKSTLLKVHGVIRNVAGKTYQHGIQPVQVVYKDFKQDFGTQKAPPLPPRNIQNTAQALPSKNQDQYDSTMGSPSTYQGKDQPPGYYESAGLQNHGQQQAIPASSSAQQPKKRNMLSRVLLAGEVVLTSVEAAAHELINNGTIAASTAAGHKFGHDAGELTSLVGGSVKNVAVVYVDIVGVGRTAILKSTAKGVIHTRTKDGQTVALQADRSSNKITAGEAERTDNGEIVVGMPEIGNRQPSPVKY